MEEYRHLLPFETASRIYCAKANIDPDQRIPTNEPVAIIGAGPKTIPQWVLVAGELLDLSMMLSSLRESAQREARAEGLALNG